MDEDDVETVVEYGALSGYKEVLEVDAHNSRTRLGSSDVQTFAVFMENSPTLPKSKHDDDHNILVRQSDEPSTPLGIRFPSLSSLRNMPPPPRLASPR